LSTESLEKRNKKGQEDHYAAPAKKAEREDRTTSISIEGRSKATQHPLSRLLLWKKHGVVMRKKYFPPCPSTKKKGCQKGSWGSSERGL